MRNLLTYKLLVTMLLCFAFSRSANAQTVNISSSFKDTMLCVQGTFQVVIVTSSSFGVTNYFEIYISDSTGNFANETKIGQYNDLVGGTATCTLPASIVAATGYRIRVKAHDPGYTSVDNGKDIRISTYPTISLNSNSPVCVGQVINLTSSSPNFQPSFTWQGPNSFSSSVQNPTVSTSTFNDSGMYYGTVSSYMCETTDSIRVNITPQPHIDSIQANTPVCLDEELKIKAFTNIPQYSCSTRIQMPPPYGNPCASVTIVKANATHAGKYFVESKIGTCIARDSIEVVIKPLPDTPTASNNGPLCIGDTLHLTGSSTTPGVTYWWSGPNNFLDSQQHPSINGIIKANEGEYKLYARKNGCNSKPGITDLVVGIPLVPLQITGDTIYCPHDRLRLTCNAPTLPGIKWTGPNGYTNIQRTITINGLTANYTGLFTVTQEVLGCKSPPSSVYVYIPDIKRPEPSTNSPLCLGEELNLTITGTTNGTYSWTGPNNFTSTEQNPTLSNITLLEKGFYRITTTLEHCTEVDSVEAIIKPQPEIADISSNTPICSGDLLQLFCNSTLDSCAYEWTGPNGFTSTEQNPSFMFSEDASGTYSVRTNRKGCVSKTKTTDIETREGPGLSRATNNSPLDEGDVLKLFGHNDKDSVEFFWEGPEGFTSNERNPVIQVSTYRNSGEYKLTTIYNKCSVTVYTDVIVNDILGIALSLYPNPNNGKFTIEGITQSDRTLNVAIFNHLGKMIYRNDLQPSQSKFKSEIDITGMPSGVYLLKVNSGIESRVERFTVIQQ